MMSIKTSEIRTNPEKKKNLFFKEKKKNGGKQQINIQAGPKVNTFSFSATSPTIVTIAKLKFFGLTTPFGLT